MDTVLRFMDILHHISEMYFMMFHIDLMILFSLTRGNFILLDKITLILKYVAKS